ncbi:MAG: hypothetical protein MPW14_11800 [Candidatus Manganitrophus sp.]|nr:MAG: hypothetical protein MPW14_11800 [Candidatus Manganitrophus sp.]
MWITNGTIADVALIWAKDDRAIIRGFLVERGTPGFSRQNKVTDKFSLRASITSELVLQDVRIPEANLLPGTDGIKSPLSLPDSGPIRDRLGGDRRRDGLLRSGVDLRQGADPVQPPDRRLPDLSSRRSWSRC